jgi:hypothetical protein|tara:strand:+ start:427 stop:816 length:390 start_codon:yes stop_codon:yes gene_type:complete
MSWKQSEGKEFAPIVHIEDAEEVVASVVEVREDVGPMGSAVVDMVTLLGTSFSLPGHAILVDKIGEQLTEEVRVCHIHRDGMVGRAVWYNVMFWTGDLGAFQKSTEGKIQITGTEKLITAKIEALPPRD